MRTSSSIRRQSLTRWFLATLVVAGLGTALALAARQEGGGPGGRGRGPGLGLSGFSIFAALDTDGQPGLSAAEIDRAPAVLRALDKNRDGRVTADELPVVGRGRAGGRGGFGPNGRGGFGGGPDREDAGGRGERGEGAGGAAATTADDLTATLMAFDANKDGKLTRAEVPERLQGLFDRADADKDGALTADEIRKSAQAQSQSSPGARGGGEGREGRGEGRFGRGGPFGADPLVSALDANNDGALSTEEIGAISTALRRFDRNNDGVVLMEEIFMGGRGRD